MKFLKMLPFAAVAITLAGVVMLSAFTPANKKAVTPKPTALGWYQFNGDATDDEYDFSNYSLSSTPVNETPDCEGIELVCAIRINPTTDVDPVTGQIRTTAPVHAEIQQALAGDENTENVWLKEE
jgi:hypothetical protein